MNIINLKLFKINITASPFLLLNYFFGKKYRRETTKLYQSPIALEGLELLLDIKQIRFIIITSNKWIGKRSEKVKKCD